MNTKTELLYFRDLNEFQTLNSEEELALLHILRDETKKHIHPDAMRRLICGNLRFVVSVARKYQGRGLSLSDLINEGNLGLFRAVVRFDSSKDVRFISYAVWWIRQAIQKAIFERVGAMRIPPNKLTLVKRFKKALLNNLGDYERTINQPEFKDSEIEIVDTMEKMMEISLDSSSSVDADGDTGNLIDVLEGSVNEQDDAIRETEIKKLIEDILSKVSPKEGKILKMFYGVDAMDDSTLRNIGEDLNISREKARQMKNRALRRMQRNREIQENIRNFLS